MGHVTIRGVSALQVLHLCLTRRKEYFVRGEQKVHSLLCQLRFVRGTPLCQAAEVGYEHCLCKAADGGIT